MSKYSYPAIFTPEENGMYSVHFPDVQGCYTCGDNLIDAIEMAQDALALMLSTYEIEGLKFSDPSNIKDIITKENEFVSFIICDTSEYRKKYNKRAVKKTLTIPEWLNEAASAVGLNFSQVLQEALIQKLNL